MLIREMEARKLLQERSSQEEMLDLTGAMLSGTSWSFTEFRKVDFNSARLANADLSNCRFIGCKFVGANLYGANLHNAMFYNCSFEDTRLGYADLRGARFMNCNTDGIIADFGTVGFWPVCPVEGAFIGWKWANNCLVKLRIPEDARRSSGTSRKCRCDKAEVLEITKDGEPVEVTFSDHDFTFMYQVGKIVEEPKYDPDRWKTCAPGIHFFMTKEEAENHGRY